MGGGLAAILHEGYNFLENSRPNVLSVCTIT